MIPVPTVTQQFSHAILQACRRLDIALPQWLHAELEQHPERVPLPVQDELWQAIAAARPDPLVGLKIGREIQVGHLDSAGLLLMSCETLGDAIRALLEYFPIISEGSSFGTTAAVDGTWLTYQPGYETCLHIRAEAVIACVAHLARWMTGGEAGPAAAHFRHAPAAPAARYETLLGCPVTFETEGYGLLYTERALRTPLIQANAVMREHLQHLADKMLAALEHAETANQVQALVRHHPRWGKERIAELLGISGRHLNRRLAEEGTSFKLLHDATLRTMAVEKLRGEASVREIAATLGFADESGFAKAFKRWTGVSPAQFRKDAG